MSSGIHDMSVIAHFLDDDDDDDDRRIKGELILISFPLLNMNS